MQSRAEPQRKRDEVLRSRTFRRAVPCIKRAVAAHPAMPLSTYQPPRSEKCVQFCCARQVHDCTLVDRCVSCICFRLCSENLEGT
jgi:hypothetical protein